MAMKRYKIRFFTLTDDHLNMFHDAEHLQQPRLCLNVKGSTVVSLFFLSLRYTKSDNNKVCLHTSAETIRRSLCPLNAQGAKLEAGRKG